MNAAAAILAASPLALTVALACDDFAGNAELARLAQDRRDMLRADARGYRGEADQIMASVTRRLWLR